MHQKKGYWYRSKRIGKRVVSEYMGRGEVAALGAQMEAFDAQQARAERELERTRLEAAQDQARAVDVPIEALGAHVQEVMRQVLEACGYHQHARGQWRKKRANTMTDTASQQSQPKQRQVLSDTEREVLYKQAATDRDAARLYLDTAWQDEASSKVYVRINDVARQAQHSLINSVEGGGANELFKEICERRMVHIRRDLAGDNPTPLERMLIERIALCWLHVHIVEMTVASRSATMTLTVGEYQQKRLDKAHKRHLQAIMALAQVRKMALPTPAPNVQINLASEGGQVRAAQIIQTPQEAPQVLEAAAPERPLAQRLEGPPMKRRGRLAKR